MWWVSKKFSCGRNRTARFATILSFGLMILLPEVANATRVGAMSMNELFNNTGGIFIGLVRSVDTSCPGGKKPCTKVTFTEIEAVVGAIPKGELTFELPEGQLDDGTFLRISGAPSFTPGIRYLVFVRAGDWFNSPITNWYFSVFRELHVGARGEVPIFVNQFGRAVRGFDEEGFRLGEPLFPAGEESGVQVAVDSGNTARAHSAREASAQPPQVGDELRKQLAQPDIDWKSLAMPKEQLIQELRAAAKKYDFSDTKPIHFAPASRSINRTQSGVDAPRKEGLEPAAEEPARPPRPTEEPYDSEFKPLKEPPARTQSHPGREGSR